MTSRPAFLIALGLLACANPATVGLAGRGEPPMPVGDGPPAVTPGSRLELMGLSPVRAYERGKVPVVLVHGLWGRPSQWSAMIAALEAEPSLRDRFQFWTFGYATGDPIPYSAHLLRRALREARRRHDPDGTDRAFDRMVVVGHSMGGLLAKMTATGSRGRIWDLYATQPPARLAGRPGDTELFRQVMLFEPLPEVRRVVFIATPHRGARLDDGPLQRIGTRLARTPDPLRASHASLLEKNDPGFFTELFRRGLPTSVDLLVWDHPLLVELGKLDYREGVERHSIIADLRDPPLEGGGDGVVPFESAHLENVASEKLVHAGHLCLDRPEVIREVARILSGRGG